MPTYYKDVYMKRLNRYGMDYKTRIQTQREKEFELYLLRSVSRIDFEYNDEIHPGIFEKYKQDETEVLYYLLTRVEDQIPNGTILSIPDHHGGQRPWMVWYFEDFQTSGYNRYIMLRMTHYVKWRDWDEQEHKGYCYLYGQEDNMLKDEIKSRSRMSTVYSENLKLSFMVMPRDSTLQKEVIVQLGNVEDPFYEEYRITGQDLQSTPGVTYISIDPTYVHDFTKQPKKEETDSDADYFWLNGGDNT